MQCAMVDYEYDFAWYRHPFKGIKQHHPMITEYLKDMARHGFVVLCAPIEGDTWFYRIDKCATAQKAGQLYEIWARAISKTCERTHDTRLQGSCSSISL